MLMMLDLLRGHDVRAGSRLLETQLFVRDSVAPQEVAREQWLHTPLA